eukprot:TRINITY_DN1427_c0_g1_i2.p1 TRINITY_DN1427_c0_g1~~TRINITY_DN1427_c0_g1_i2.p1  ORF type:complete len:85 (-),score=23.08 TRINITY_DN1427_c0_g1_i2:442-696(-)
MGDICSQDQEVYGKLTLVTFNVWFRTFELDNRIDAILDIVEETDADFVAFQEVTDRFMYKLTERKEFDDKYDITEEIQVGYGTV